MMSPNISSASCSISQQSNKINNNNNINNRVTLNFSDITSML